MKSFFSWLLIFVVLITVICSSLAESELDTNKSITDLKTGVTVSFSNSAVSGLDPSKPFLDLKTGDSVKFGSYKQNGNQDEPIDWIVLTIDKKNKKALLLSSKGIDAISYGAAMDTGEYVKADMKWETSFIRKWLNGDFYQSAFTSEDKTRIIKTTVQTRDKAGSQKTEDSVFILSSAEVKKYFKKSKDMSCVATDYAKGKLKIQQGAITDDGYALWWLRDMVKVAKVDKKGNFMNNTGNEAGFIFGSLGLKAFNKGNGGPVFCDYLYVVRPAIWVAYDESPKPTAASKPKPTSKPKATSKYMSRSDLVELGKYYFGLYGGDKSSITMTDYAEEGDKCVVLIVYGRGSIVGIMINRKDGSYLGMRKSSY